ncbi:terpene synthase family protein [Nocardia thraciensis]
MTTTPTGDPTSVFTTLLSFYCPTVLVEEAGPDADRVRERTLAWARRFDLGDGDTQHTTMVALTGAASVAHLFPHATGALAQALADYNAWAWVANTVLESTEPLRDILACLGRWERIIRSPGSYPEATATADLALADVFGRLRTLLTPVQWQRFTVGQGTWLYHMAWEASLRERNIPLTVNDYLAMRGAAAGVYSCASYLDAVEGIELDEQRWAHPTVRAAAESSMFAAALDNDRYSYHRERDLPVHKTNLIDAVRHDHPDYTLAQATTEAVAIRDRMLTCYLRLREHLLPAADHALTCYLTGLDRVVSGNLTFGATATRYLLAESPYTITRTHTPSDTTPTPLPYPTIAWWWDQLP